MMTILYQGCASLLEPPCHAISLEQTLSQPGATSHVSVVVNPNCCDLSASRCEVKRLGTTLPHGYPQDTITVGFSLDSCGSVGWDVETRPIGIHAKCQL